MPMLLLDLPAQQLWARWLSTGINKYFPTLLKCYISSSILIGLLKTVGLFNFFTFWLTFLYSYQTNYCLINLLPASNPPLLSIFLLLPTYWSVWPRRRPWSFGLLRTGTNGSLMSSVWRYPYTSGIILTHHYRYHSQIMLLIKERI